MVLNSRHNLDFNLVIYILKQKINLKEGITYGIQELPKKGVSCWVESFPNGTRTLQIGFEG